MKKRILFVCLGNICRSPTAEALFRGLVERNGLSEQFEIDSAGTYGGHAGELPDPRMRVAASKRGYELNSRSRQVCYDDFIEFDMIIGMDDSNISNLQRMAPDIESKAKIVRMADFCTMEDVDHVPDQYYGGSSGFDNVLDILEDACLGLLKQTSKE